MRHLKKIHKLNRASDQRKALMRSLLRELVLNWEGGINTTLAKAKALRPYAEKVFTKAIKAHKTTDPVTKVHYLRLIRKLLDEKIIGILMANISSIEDRPGGYLRILKTQERRGDATQMALIKVVQSI